MTAWAASLVADREADVSHMCSSGGNASPDLNRDSVKGVGQGLLPRRLLFLATVLNLLLLVQPQSFDLTELNQQIQVAAFQSFPRRVFTGTAYNATLPGNLSSLVDVQMIRFRTGRLRRTGYTFLEYPQVILPNGTTVEGDFRHVVLVLRSFKNFSLHPSLPGTQFLAPVVGIYIYNGSTLTDFGPRPPLRVTATLEPITYSPSEANNVREGSNLTCVLFSATNFTALASNNLSVSPSVCSWDTVGDFALLGPLEMETSDDDDDFETWKIAVIAAAGAVALILLLGLLIFLGRKYRQRAKFAKMERVADQGEPLHETLIAGGRAPSAASTRTKPILESDYAG